MHAHERTDQLPAVPLVRRSVYDPRWGPALRRLTAKHRARARHLARTPPDRGIEPSLRRLARSALAGATGALLVCGLAGPQLLSGTDAPVTSAPSPAPISRPAP